MRNSRRESLLEAEEARRECIRTRQEIAEARREIREALMEAKRVREMIERRAKPETRLPPRARLSRMPKLKTFSAKRPAVAMSHSKKPVVAIRTKRAVHRRVEYQRPPMAKKIRVRKPRLVQKQGFIERFVFSRKE